MMLTKKNWGLPSVLCPRTKYLQLEWKHPTQMCNAHGDVGNQFIICIWVVYQNATKYREGLLAVEIWMTHHSQTKNHDTHNIVVLRVLFVVLSGLRATLKLKCKYD